MITFSWHEPFDNGGSSIQEYELEITRVIDSFVDTKAVVNALQYSYNLAEGLVAGREYSVRLRAKNYYTQYFSQVGSWSASSIYFSSDLPQPVASLSFTGRSKTDVAVNWSYLPSDADKGYSTINPYYLLYMDDCQGGEFS